MCFITYRASLTRGTPTVLCTRMAEIRAFRAKPTAYVPMLVKRFRAETRD